MGRGRRGPKKPNNSEKIGFLVLHTNDFIFLPFCALLKLKRREPFLNIVVSGEFIYLAPYAVFSDLPPKATMSLFESEIGNIILFLNRSTNGLFSGLNARPDFSMNCSFSLLLMQH